MKKSANTGLRLIFISATERHHPQVRVTRFEQRTIMPPLKTSLLTHYVNAKANTKSKPSKSQPTPTLHPRPVKSRQLQRMETRKNPQQSPGLKSHGYRTI
ncbi:hypothetical protein Y032_0652g1160 [Ancylostoma ceylanicum]|uniref:Uncharacterized protein n=1 Tax=Ancylostoma ceylanicum TaxID=53326 RepID=A0A016WIC1_9BILA|nr:hypothetical protein Y032_0652g1160 [Ancylostoma ceylanicum]